MHNKLVKEQSNTNTEFIQASTLRLKGAARYLGISLTTLWRLSENDPAFPKKIRVSSRCCLYKISDLDTYLSVKQGEA